MVRLRMVDPSSVAGILGGLAGGLGGVIFRRNALMTRLALEDRARWDDLSLATRRRIRKAVRKGRAVDDPQHAKFAVAIARADGARRSTTPLLLVAAFAFFVVVVIGASEGRAASAALNGVIVVFLIGLVVWAVPRQRRRLAHAEAANRALVDHARTSPTPA
jgi:Flp pilus assembly protein TadB